MAPKLMLPVDFGVENLKREFHNNVVFKLQGGEEMRANSLILSFHSSEFVRLFLELNQSVLEMDDFSKDSVKSFLEALYSGEIQLDRNLFRDVNKMCHVFKVDWLSRRCGDYFEGLVGDIRPSTDYQTLLFLFEEARFSLKMMKCDKMIDIVVKKICGLENRAEVFVKPYMTNYRELGINQLDLMLQITRCNPVTLLQIISENFIGHKEQMFDDASRYILENVDLCKCISDDEPQFEELFDALESVTLSCDSDAALVNKLYRMSVRDFKRKNFASPTSVSNSSLSGNHQTPKSTLLPHIFCSLESFIELPPKEYFQKLTESPLVLNLYMFIEGLLTSAFSFTDLTPEMVWKIENTRRQRSWSRIPREFLTYCHPYDEPIVNKIIIHSSDLISEEEGVRRVGKPIVHNEKVSKPSYVTVRNLFLSPVTFLFHFKHPKIDSCRSAGKCGFLLKFEPELKAGKPFKFKVRLCVNPKDYPDGLHFHNHLTADKIHLVYSVREEGAHYEHATLTWNEQGVTGSSVDGDGVVKWNIGPSCLDPSHHLKITAFVTL